MDPTSVLRFVPGDRSLDYWYLLDMNRVRIEREEEKHQTDSQTQLTVYKPTETLNTVKATNAISPLGIASHRIASWASLPHSTYSYSGSNSIPPVLVLILIPL